MNYTFRLHDPRVGMFFATDPLFTKYPWYSPYQFSGNRLIDMEELEGLEPAPSEARENPPTGMATDYNSGVITEVSPLDEVLVTNRIGAKIMSAVQDIAVSTLRPVAEISNKLLGDLSGASSISKELNACYDARYAPSTSSTPAFVVIGVLSGGLAYEAGALYELGVFSMNNGFRAKVLGGFGNFFSQYASNKFDVNKVDYFDVGMSTFFGGGGSTLTKAFVDIKPETGFQFNSLTDTFLNYQSSRYASKLSKFTLTPIKPFLEKSTMGSVIQTNVDIYFKIITTVVKNEIKEDINDIPKEDIKN